MIECLSCSGRGFFEVKQMESKEESRVPCEVCRGTGKE